MKLPSPRRFACSLFIVIGLYACMPVIAGMFRLGQPRGPVIYRDRYHRLLYDVGSHLVHGRGVRSTWREVFYSRAPFYGWPETLLPRPERLKLVESGSVNPEVYSKVEPELERKLTR